MRHKDSHIPRTVAPVPGRAQIEQTDPRVRAQGGLAYAFERRRRPLWPGGPFVSALGFGAQRLRLNAPAVSGGPAEEGEAALRHALELGVNLIDTRAGDADGQSELVVGRVLADCISRGSLRREGVVLMGKVGDFRGHDFEALVALERAGLQEDSEPRSSVFLCGPDQCLSFSKQAIRAQVFRSCARLGVQCLDLVLLENPESALRSIGRKVSDPTVAAELLQRGLVEAFSALRELCAEGVIAAFGVSSGAFVMPAGSAVQISLDAVLSAAEQAGARDAFKVIALPLNWIEVGALLSESENAPNLLDRARTAGLGVVVQRPLNALSRGQLIRLARPRLDEQALLGLDTARQRGLENWARLARDLEDLGRSQIQTVGYEDAPLSQLAACPLAHIEGVSSVLVGMRRRFYVEDMLEGLTRPVVLRARDVVLALHSQLEFEPV